MAAHGAVGPDPARGKLNGKVTSGRRSSRNPARRPPPANRSADTEADRSTLEGERGEGSVGSQPTRHRFGAVAGVQYALNIQAWSYRIGSDEAAPVAGAFLIQMPGALASSGRASNPEPALWVLGTAVGGQVSWRR